MRELVDKRRTIEIVVRGIEVDEVAGHEGTRINLVGEAREVPRKELRKEVLNTENDIVSRAFEGEMDFIEVNGIAKHQLGIRALRRCEGASRRDEFEENGNHRADGTASDLEHRNEDV